MTNISESIIPSEKEKELIYKFYLAIFDSGFNLPKKRVLMTALMGHEKWCWRVVGVTRSAIIEIAKNDFKPIKGLQRDHHKQSQATTYNSLFNNRHTFDDWWNVVWENDQTILMTKEEHNTHHLLNKSNVYDVDDKLGLFRNAIVGMSFTKKNEGAYIESLIRTHNIQI